MRNPQKNIYTNFERNEQQNMFSPDQKILNDFDILILDIQRRIPYTKESLYKMDDYIYQ